MASRLRAKLPLPGWPVHWQSAARQSAGQFGGRQSQSQSLVSRHPRVPSPSLLTTTAQTAFAPLCLRPPFPTPLPCHRPLSSPDSRHLPIALFEDCRSVAKTRGACPTSLAVNMPPTICLLSSSRIAPTMRAQLPSTAGRRQQERSLLSPKP